MNVYRTKPRYIEAIQLEIPTVVKTQWGTKEAVAGDWLILTASGGHAVMSDIDFCDNYELHSLPDDQDE